MALLTTCSGCGAEVTISRTGKYVVVNADEAELHYDGDGLLTWDCPACEYADSYWDDFAREFKEWLT